MNGNNGLYFIVGALVVVVGVGAFAMFGRHHEHNFGGPAIERTFTHEPDVDRSTTIRREPDGDRTVITREREEH